LGTVRPADQSRSERGVTSPRVATGRAAYSIGKAASNIALEYGAIIDKYIGDAIMVLFGDPESKGAKEDGRACCAWPSSCYDACASSRPSGRSSAPKSLSHFFSMR
jgi:class 3 adenylate cyclase